MNKGIVQKVTNLNYMFTFLQISNSQLS